METFKSIRAAQIAAALIAVATSSIDKMTACRVMAENGEERPCTIRKEFAKVAEVAKIDYWRVYKFLNRCPKFPDIAERDKEVDNLFDIFSATEKFFA